MSIKAIAWVWEQDLQATKKILLMALADHVDMEGKCFPSQAYLAKRCGLSRQYVNKTLGDLERDGLIIIEARRRADGSDRSNFYYLNMPPDIIKRDAVDVQGFVYVIADGQRSKVGITRFVERRHRGLESAIGKPLDLVKSWPCPMRVARIVEESILGRFADQRLIGEWLDVPAATVVDAVTASIHQNGVSPPETRATTAAAPGDDSEDSGATPAKTPKKNRSTSIHPKNQRGANAPSLDLGFALPDWIPQATWDAFVEMRKKIKAPLTDHAMTLTVKELSDWRAEGHDPVAILNHSISKSWRGLYKPDGRDRRGASITAVEFVDGRTWLSRTRAFFDGFDDEDDVSGEPIWRGPGFWVELWGPKPGDPGCRVPAEVLSQYDREKGSRLRQITQGGGGAGSPPAGAVDGRGPVRAS